MRQAIEKHLNKGESAHKLTRALSFGSNQEFRQDEKEEQELAEGCRRLLKNAIICWNYLYLTQQLNEAPTEARATTYWNPFVTAQWSVGNTSICTANTISQKRNYAIR